MAVDVGAKKRAGIVLVVVGVLMIIVPLLPNRELTGSGATIARTAVSISGVVALVFGLMLTRKKGHLKNPDE